MMNTLHFILILSIVHAFVYAFVHPQSVNTTLNSTVNFTCEAVADDIIFRVNGESASNTYIINRGFNQQPQNTLSDGRKRTVLLAKALEDNNNTNISCAAIEPGIVYSDIAVLRIQGLLAPVKDLTAAVLNRSSVLLMWSAPYTLDNVPVTGYNINDDQGTFIDTVNTTEYILTTTNDDPCNVTTVYVSGINGAGIGDSNNVMYYIVRVPQTIPVSVIPTVDEDNVLFQIITNVSGLCIGEYPTNIIVNIKDSNDVLQQTLSNDVTMSLVHDQLIIVNISSPINLRTYLVEVTFNNPAGHTINVFPFGFLTPVLNISSSLDNCTAITISWDRPNVDNRVQISYYILLIYDNVNKMLLQNVSINGNEYKYEAQELFHHQYTYTIYGINELGEGEHNNSTFSFQRASKYAKENTTFTILSYINNEVNLMFNIPIILECAPEAPENAKVTIQCDDVIIFNKTYLVECSMNITDILLAPQHQECTLSIIFSNNVGHSDPLINTLSTYDVINATAYPNGNSICVECVFSSAPSAKSCYVSVIGVTSKNKIFVKNSSSDLAVQGCIDNLPAGNYTVYVYDVENDIPLTSILPAIILRDIIIIDILPTSTITTVTSSPTTVGITAKSFPIIIVATTVPSVVVGIVIIIFVVVVGVYKRKKKHSINLVKTDDKRLSAKVQSTTPFESDMTHCYDEKKVQFFNQDLPNFSKKRHQAFLSSSDKIVYADILHFPPKTEQYPPSYDDIEPSISSNTTILANLVDDTPPIRANTNKTSDTTKQISNNEEFTGGLTSSSFTSTNEQTEYHVKNGTKCVYVTPV